MLFVYNRHWGTMQNVTKLTMMANLTFFLLLLLPKGKSWLKSVIADFCREPVALFYASTSIFMLLHVIFYVFQFFFTLCETKKQPGFTVTHSRVVALLCLMSHACPHMLPTCLPLWKMTLQSSFTEMGWQWHIDGLVAVTVKVESLICVSTFPDRCLSNTSFDKEPTGSPFT